MAKIIGSHEGRFYDECVFD